MNRHEFWLAYAKFAGISQAESKRVCKSVFAFLSKCIEEEDRVHVFGLGSFERKKIKARRLRNVKDGEMMVIPEREKIVFKSSTKASPESTEQEDCV